MRVIVRFKFMTRMHMIVGTVVSSVLVVMHMLVSTMGMLVGMFMLVFMGMAM